MELKPQKWEGGYGPAGLFVHRKFIVGSTPSNPINLKEGVKARWVSPFRHQCLPLPSMLQVSYKQGTQDSKPCALEVLMLGSGA
jgi:hypothetical protein